MSRNITRTLQVPLDEGAREIEVGAYYNDQSTAAPFYMIEFTDRLTGRSQMWAVDAGMAEAVFAGEPLELVWDWISERNPDAIRYLLWGWE